MNKFKSFDSLRERIQEIICNDSIPQISVKSERVIKNVYPIDFCEKGFISILFKEKNVIELHNDTLFKAEKAYPLDSLSEIMRKDYSNNGKDPTYSDNPERLIIYISYDTNGLKKLNSILNIVTDSYDKIKTNFNLNIYLNEKITILPPPPLPKFDDNN